MKRWLVWIPVLLLLLAGCEAELPPETTAPQETSAPQQTYPTEPGCYDPDSQMELLTGGAVRAYPLEGSCIGIGRMGQKLMVFTQTGDDTVLTRLTGDAGMPDAETVLPGLISPALNNVWLRGNLVAYYEAGDNCLVLLDESLQEMRRLPLMGEPLGLMTMDPALTTLYYGTNQELRALDLETGISRLLRQHICQEQSALMSIRDNSILVCRVVETDGTSGMAFISTQTGQILAQDSELQAFTAWEEDWFAVHTDGSVTELLYGSGESDPRLWLPLESEAVFCNALEMGGIVAVTTSQNGVSLALYDMAQGSRKAAVGLPANQVDHLVVDSSGSYIWFLARNTRAQADTLCRWDPAASTLTDPTNYTTQRYTLEDPDLEGLAHCRAQADALEEEYGVTIHLEDAGLVPEGYQFTWEHQVKALQMGLEQLEKGLKVFPEGFFQTVARVSDNRTFTISLVRELRYDGGMPVEDGDGLQYWIKGKAYLAVAISEETEQAFYHQLCHMMESYIATKTSRLDTWDTLNPEGFAYFENYTDHLTQEDSPYLEGEEQAFFDAFSMSYPREDIATVMEHALTDGNEEYFQSPVLQAKLDKLCQAIRRAFRWRKDPREFPWEQYLETSMAYVED